MNKHLFVKTAVICILSALLCTVCFGIVGSFPDVAEDAPYADAVASLAEKGIITGDNYGNFNPTNNITRAEAVTIICRMMEVDSAAKKITSCKFNDVENGHWAAGYVAKASELGIINGYPDGTFRPSDPVTFEQMVKIIICFFGMEDDANDLGGYPEGYIEVAKNTGLIEEPIPEQSAPADRATVAVMCYNALM